MTQGRSNSWRHSRCWSPNQRQGPGCRGHTLRRWLRRGVGAPHLRGMQDGPVSPARCEGCANLRWRAGRFRRHVAGGMPLSDSVAVLASREEDRPSPSCAAGCGAGDIGVCCLYSGLLHRRPPMHRTGTQGCAPVPHTHCCRRSPRQIRGHICILNCSKKATQDAVLKHPYVWTLRLAGEYRNVWSSCTASTTRKRMVPVFQSPPALPQFCQTRNMHRRVTLPVLLRP